MCLLIHKFDKIVVLYQQCELKMFREFAELLERYKPEILASFTYVSVLSKNHKSVIRRLSNGPTESFNNNPKDLKRVSNGVADFEYTRNRILWATRDNPPVLVIPRSDDEVRTITGINRGPYNKK